MYEGEIRCCHCNDVGKESGLASKATRRTPGGPDTCFLIGSAFAEIYLNLVFGDISETTDI